MSNTLKTITPKWLQNTEAILTSELTTETRSSNVSEVLSWLDQIRPANIPHRLWLECQTVIIEGFDNVIKHAHKDLVPETLINLKLRIYPQGIEMQIWDHGEAFDLISILEKAPDKVEMEIEHGRGLIIMGRILDYITYTRRFNQGNCLQMIKEF
jgi:anti-sigma regulatory factor (Ser/Thr protein kinase)